MKMIVLCALLALNVPSNARAESDPSATSTVGDIAEVTSPDPALDATLRAVYAVISGPVGQERDFDAMRALFTPDARLTAITPRGPVGGTVEDYIAHSGPLLVSSGFTERQLDRRLEIYGDLAHAWSSYEGTFTQADGSPGSVRGINSIQLVRQSDGRWLVQAILWQQETPANPLPDDLAGE